MLGSWPQAVKTCFAVFPATIVRRGRSVACRVTWTDNLGVPVLFCTRFSALIVNAVFVLNYRLSAIPCGFYCCSDRVRNNNNEPQDTMVHSTTDVPHCPISSRLYGRGSASQSPRILGQWAPAESCTQARVGLALGVRSGS
jgi:hypothetical protein